MMREQQMAESAVDAADCLFMDFVSQVYLPRVRASGDAAVVWAEEVRATALVWEFGDLPLSAIDEDRVQAFRAKNNGKTPVAIVELYVALLDRMLAKAAEWGYLASAPFPARGASLVGS